MAPILSRLSSGGGGGLGGFGFGKKGGSSGPLGPFTTSGGTEITNGGYKYHVFIGPGPQPFVVTGEPGSATILVIAAGGTGGAGWQPGSSGTYAGGGGGAGGIAYAPNLTISSGTHTVIAGEPAPNSAGGTGNGGTDAPRVAGGYSTFGHNGSSAEKPYGVQVGGGTPGGQGGNPSGPPWGDSGSPSPAGGSTGGGGARGGYVGQGVNVVAATPVSGWTFYANKGSPADPAGNPNASASGGGGAGGAGNVTPANQNAGPGGAGQAFPEFPAPVIAPAIPAPVRSQWTTVVGPTGVYGGGGGGACQSGDAGGSNPMSSANNNPGGGGTGGGGPGSYPYSGFPGIDYTGGGGGGSAGNRPAGSTTSVGGRGIIIVRVAV